MAALFRPTVNPEQHQTKTPATITCCSLPCHPHPAETIHARVWDRRHRLQPQQQQVVEPHLSKARKGGRGRSGALGTSSHARHPALFVWSRTPRRRGRRCFILFVRSHRTSTVTSSQASRGSKPKPPCVHHHPSIPRILGPLGGNSLALRVVGSSALVPPHPSHRGLRRELPLCGTFPTAALPHIRMHAVRALQRTHAVDPLAQRRLSSVEPRGLLDRMWHPHVAHLALHLFVEPRILPLPFINIRTSCSCISFPS